ncbi:MAG: hypothetical protein CFE26_02635 [Verrucomicrobiales bacterium VVV1]|nr:MAG: hypothetical protein CFE26_02635 [Verrucomicrobiales bacterium VVV1]
MENSPVDGNEAPPANWREAVADLLSARVELIRLEAKQAAEQGARKAVVVAILAISAAFTWALFLVGVIPLLSESTGVHLFVALLMVARLRRPGSPTFPITRDEFQRDREWFKNLQPPE